MLAAVSLHLTLMCAAAVYCGVVQLHFALAEYELVLGAQGHPQCIHPDGTLGGFSYERCTEACRANALAAALVADMDMSKMHMFIGIAWVCVSEVLTRDIPRLRLSGQLAQANEKERQWEIVEKCMERLITTYPVMSGSCVVRCAQVRLLTTFLDAGLQLKQLRAMKKEEIARLSRMG